MDLLVISDEIYDRLVYGGASHTPIAALPGMQERTITLGGFSKSHAMTGWRVAWAAAPSDLFGGMLKIHQYAHDVPRATVGAIRSPRSRPRRRGICDLDA